VTEASESSDLSPGAVVGDYELVAPISTGAMGAVYTARRRGGEELVAVKRLLDPRDAVRFEIEARLLSQLSHPRVVGVLDHFVEANGRYLVMELVGGANLVDLVNQRGQPGLPIDEAVGYALQLCEALTYVHDQQVIHRDVKPDNVIVGDGGVTLVDFGIAREYTDVDEGTIGIGTPRYMAPEVLAGGIVSPRSDVFGAAATLWTVLAGEPPMYGAVDALSDLVPEASHQLDAALRGGLAIDPHDRFPDMRALAAALGADELDAVRGRSLERSVERPTVPRDLLVAVVRAAAGVFEAAASSIALVDAKGGDLVYEAAWGAGADEIVGVRLPAGSGIAGAVVAAGKAEAVADCRGDSRFAQRVAAGTGYVPHTMIVVPLRRDGVTIGALSVLDRRDGRAYAPRDATRAEAFGDLAVLAVAARGAAADTVVPRP
jgi:predicted Ser/Thr protein kinase